MYRNQFKTTVHGNDQYKWNTRTAGGQANKQTYKETKENQAYTGKWERQEDRNIQNPTVIKSVAIAVLHIPLQIKSVAALHFLQLPRLWL